MIPTRSEISLLLYQLKAAVLSEIPDAKKSRAQAPVTSQGTEKAQGLIKPAPATGAPTPTPTPTKIIARKESFSTENQRSRTSPKEMCHDYSEVLALFKKTGLRSMIFPKPPSDATAKAIAGAWKKKVAIAYFLLGSESEEEASFFEKAAAATSEKIAKVEVVRHLPLTLPDTLEAIFYTPSAKIDTSGFSCACYPLKTAAVYRSDDNEKKQLWNSLKNLL